MDGDLLELFLDLPGQVQGEIVRAMSARPDPGLGTSADLLPRSTARPGASAASAGPMDAPREVLLGGGQSWDDRGRGSRGQGCPTVAELIQAVQQALRL